MSIITKIFKYLEPLWTGADNKISLRNVGAIVLIYNFVENINWAIQKWDAGRSMEGLSLIMGIEAGLITALLGLTAWSNMTAKKIDADMFAPADTTINVQKAESVTNAPTTKAETVNAEKVDTVNSSITNIGSKEPEDAK